MKRGGLLIILVLLLAGGIGTYVYNQTKEDDYRMNSNQSSQNNNKYLIIPEKGIKLKLTTKLDDAYYFINSRGDIYISAHRFDNIKGAEDCTAKGKYGDGGGGLAAITMAKPGDDHFGTPWTKEELEQRSSTLINNNYYWLEFSKSGCTDPNDPNSDHIEAEAATLREELAKIRSPISEVPQ